MLTFLKSPHFLLNGEKQMTGSAGQQRVPWNYFARTPFPLPPFAEQQRIVAKVEELLALCDELAARQTAAREHRTRLVHLTTAKDESAFKRHSVFCLKHSELLFDSVPALRQAILSLAVQGRLVQQDPNDEPASELIARVRK
jgi:type I restriction enzyme S subunit